jgi:hypothetical protein
VITPAHDQKFVHSYVVAYPAHEPRQGDPHYVDFEHIREQWKNDPEKWQCAIGKERQDFSECSLDEPLQLHHAHIEFALINAVDLKWLEHLYPGVSNPDQVGAWAESAANLVVLCAKHHIGYEGVHKLDSAMYEAMKILRPGTIQP